MKIRIYFVSAAFLSAVILDPLVVSADHTMDHALQHLQMQLASIQMAVNSLLAVKPVEPPGQAKKATITPATTAAPYESSAAASVQRGVIEKSQPVISPKGGPKAAPSSGSVSESVTRGTQPTQRIDHDYRSSVPPLSKNQVVTEIKNKIQELQKQLEALREKMIQSGAPELKTQPGQRKEQPPFGVGAQMPAPAKPALARNAQRGVSGNDIKNVQALLKQFPGIYPRGFATGFYGPATENAVKKLQEKLGLPATGGIDETTKKKINEIAAAVERKQPPKITGLNPAEISVGTKVIIVGSGFTLENNSLFVKGKTILTGLTSHDGTAIVFSVPSDIPCYIGAACPVKITNANGISNAKPFKLVEAVPAPVPEPTPEPVPEPAPEPVSAPVGPPTVSLSASSLTITAGQPFTLTVSGTSDAGLAAVWWYGNNTGITNATVISSYPVAPTSDSQFMTPVVNPTTLDRVFASPKFSAAQAVKSYSFSSAVTIPTAGVYEFGANSRDVLYPTVGEPHQASEGAGLATLKITVVAPTPPPPAAPTLARISPSMVTTGMRATLNGTGFTPANNTVTFTGSFTEPNQVISGVVSSDGVTLEVTIPATMPCRPIVVSQCSVFVTNQNGESNRLSFWLGQHVDPVHVLTPNGGEQLTQGVSSLISASGGKSEAFSDGISISYALVDVSATTASDPSALIIGWIQHNGSSITWGANKVCDYDNANAALPAPGSCWDVSPGNYKILAVGRDMMNLPTVWDITANTPGNIDVSDQAFTIISAPVPSFNVVSPNGGEAYKHGDSVAITWEAKSIASKLVNIKLFKAGVLAMNIASNVSQSEANGLFLYNWVIPNYIAPSSDYRIEISDAVHSVVKDTSDTAFKISYNAALQIYGPNGGEAAMRGFSTLLFWTYSGYTPATINVHLYKGGVLYRTLATGVAPVGFSGFTFLRGSYPTNSRYAEIPIALDIPEGDDYTLEIVDGADVTIRDMSDAPFRVISLPNPVTFIGKMVDAVSGAAMPGIAFSTWSGLSWIPAFTTGVNGEFSYSADIAGMLNPATRYQQIFSGIPQCNDATAMSLYRYPDFPRTTFGGWYGQLYPPSSVRRQYLPVVSSVMNLGDVPMWPSADFIHTFTDLPLSFGVYYVQGGGGMGNSTLTTQHGLQNTPPLGIDVYVQYKDGAGIVYNSPATKFSTDTRCLIATHSFMDGTHQWEPYPIGISYSAAGETAGALYAGKLTTFTSHYGYSVGVAPLTWSIAFGTLPPGLSLNSVTGEITGIPTTVGTYVFGVRVKDVNGVRASRDMSIIIR